MRQELPRFSLPIVVKADGLAAGKGVVICQTHLQAEQTAAQMFSGALLGVAETYVVLEEFLHGEELSFFALCDGKHAVALAAAQDHKRVGEGDTGPNTGGMGAYTGDGLLSAPMQQWLLKNVAQRVVDEMALEGTPFHGILFCGMMMVPQRDGTTLPMVLEFNTRFGDPETQAILVRLADRHRGSLRRRDRWDRQTGSQFRCGRAPASASSRPAAAIPASIPPACPSRDSTPCMTRTRSSFTPARRSKTAQSSPRADACSA